MKKCCEGVLRRSIVGKSGRKSVVGKFCGEVLWQRVIAKCCGDV